MNTPKTKTTPLSFILLLFYISGAVALVYQVVWSRMMIHVFGSTALAVGTVLSAFMCGMAVGAWWFGKVADRSPNCFRLYALLEVGIAVAAFISHSLLGQFEPVNLALFNFFESSALLYSIVRFMLAFVLVMVPTVFMGATLPVLTRFLARQRSVIGVKLSTLYSINTFGAVTGVLLTGFFLIGKFGIHVPVYMAVVGNLLIGGVAWLLSRHVVEQTGSFQTSGETDAVVPPGINPPGPGMIKLVILGLGISGFTSFAYEIYWTRSLVFILGNSTYALTTMLSAFLTGIALGGYLVRFLIIRVRDRCALFGWIQVFLGVASALALPLLFAFGDPQTLTNFLVKDYNQAYTTLLVRFLPSFALMLIPAILIGATFPLVGQIGVRSPRQTGSTVGRIYAVNTLGNVVGALLPGLVLLNWLGIQKGILAMAALNATIGFVILFTRLMPASRHRAWRMVLPAALVLSLAGMGQAPMDFQFPSKGEVSSHQTLFYREGPLATTKVTYHPKAKTKDMSIDGIIIGGDGPIEYKQYLLAHMPKLLREDVSTELSIGLGSGILAGESTLHPQVRSITSVEIEPSVIEGARLFDEENHHLLDNPRSQVILDDVGNFLRTTNDRYQVITADEKIAQDFASNGFSYSLEYYELLRRHLTDDGMVAQWVPADLPLSLFKMVLKTFSDSFPHVQLWYFLPARQVGGPKNAILIGSNEKILIDPGFMGRQLAANPAAFRSLEPYGLTSVEPFLSHYVADERYIRPVVKDVATNSLVFPRYEFYLPWKEEQVQGNGPVTTHDLMIQLKRQASTEYFAELSKRHPDVAKLRATMTSENSYLLAYQKYISGAPLAGVYRQFDSALAMAPWNQSLRAQIYSEYLLASIMVPSMANKIKMKQRAQMLYQKQQRQ
jgi:spermidine synthase